MKSTFLSLFALTLMIVSGVPMARAAAGIGPSFKGPIGLQLYSLRNQFATNVPGTLDQVRDFGITYVELAGTYNLPPDKFLEMLKARNLKAVSGHFPYARYKTDPEGVARDAKALGLQYAGCAWIDHKDPFTEAQCRDAAAVFNKAGEIMAKNGIQFFYHIHGFEFQPHGAGTLVDLLMTETNPKWVNYQMDTFWIAHPGQDPVKMLQKYPERWVLMHVKDMKKGVKGDLSGHSDVRNDVTVGTGQLDWPAILRESKRVGVKYYFIEDESPISEKQIPGSLKYLEQVQW